MSDVVKTPRDWRKWDTIENNVDCFNYMLKKMGVRNVIGQEYFPGSGEIPSNLILIGIIFFHDPYLPNSNNTLADNKELIFLPQHPNVLNCGMIALLHVLLNAEVDDNDILPTWLSNLKETLINLTLSQRKDHVVKHGDLQDINNIANDVLNPSSRSTSENTEKITKKTAKVGAKPSTSAKLQKIPSKSGSADKIHANKRVSEDGNAVLRKKFSKSGEAKKNEGNLPCNSSHYKKSDACSKSSYPSNKEDAGLSYLNNNNNTGMNNDENSQPSVIMHTSAFKNNTVEIDSCKKTETDANVYVNMLRELSDLHKIIFLKTKGKRRGSKLNGKNGQNAFNNEVTATNEFLVELGPFVRFKADMEPITEIRPADITNHEALHKKAEGEGEDNANGNTSAGSQYQNAPASHSAKRNLNMDFEKCQKPDSDYTSRSKTSHDLNRMGHYTAYLLRDKFLEMDGLKNGPVILEGLQGVSTPQDCLNAVVNLAKIKNGSFASNVIGIFYNPVYNTRETCNNLGNT